MKFHKTLEKGQVNVWKDFYIPYNELKNTIKNNKGRFENEILLSLAKIDGFYLKVEGLILEEKNKMIKRMRRKNDDSKSKSGSNESSKKTDSPPVGRTKNGEGKILERKEIEGAIKNADSNIGRALSDLDSEINVKAQEIRNTLLEDTSTERNSDSAVEYKVTSDKIEGDGSKNKEGKRGSASKAKKDGKDKKSDKKKLIRSFDDNSITKKQKQIKSSTKFSVFNLFKFKDKYSHRQKEKNITKLIEVCESMKKYASLNFTGFRKIIKKYDKFHDAKMTDVLMPIVKKSYFYRSKRVEHATDELKGLYKTHFAGNDKRKAKNVFQNIAKREKSSQMSSFFSGSFLSLSIFIYYSIEFQKDDMLRSIFTGFNMIFYGFLLFGLCIIVFKKYYINYAFIFDFDITTQESIGTYFFIVSTFCLVHNLGFFLVKRYSVTTQTVAVYVNLILLTFPFGVFYKNTRYFFIYALTKMLTTPFFSVQFRHFYIADCLQSFTYAYKLIFLYYINNSKSKILLAICLTPCLIRIMQCYKRSCEESNMKVHMLNTLKYTLAILFIISCYLYNLHENDYTLSSKLFFGVASSFYSLYWDLVRDWEIRRKVRIYNITFLLFIALYNCICRFAWVVTHYQSQFEMVVALMEVHRRFLWTLLRVECEHLNNRDSLKAICGFTGKLSDMFFKAEDELESGISEDEKIDDTIVI